MKETATLTIKLLLITAIVAALLGGVNMVTSPIIAENTEAAFNENMKELLPEADKFEKDGTKLPEPESGVTVDGIYAGMLDDGTIVGYVASAVCGEGYGGDIVVMLGIDSDCKVTKAKVTEMSETPGLGAKSQSEWIDQYSGLGQDIQVDKNGSAASAEYKVEAISGATITSKAVTKAINASLDAARVVIDDNMPPSEEVENNENLDENQSEEGQPSAEPELIDSETEANQEDSENSEEVTADNNEDVEGGAAE